MLGWENQYYFSLSFFIFDIILHMYFFTLFSFLCEFLPSSFQPFPRPDFFLNLRKKVCTQVNLCSPSLSLSLSLSVQCRVTSQLVWYPLLSLPFCCLPGLLRRLDCWKMFSHVHIHGYPRHLISRVSISSSTTLQLLLCNIHLYIHFDNVVHICQNLLACPYFSFISFTLCTLCRS